MEGNLSEYAPQESLFGCLKTKRIIERQQQNIHTTVRWACKNGTVEMEKIGDKWVSKKMIQLD